jgi:hypothetical protein
LSADRGEDPRASRSLNNVGFGGYTTPDLAVEVDPAILAGVRGTAFLPLPLFIGVPPSSFFTTALVFLDGTGDGPSPPGRLRGAREDDIVRVS